MSNVIKLKRGTSTPSTSDIASGEVAIDTSAKKLYINDSGTIKEVGGGDGTATASLTAFGVNAGDSVTSGADNSTFGAYAGDAITTGSQNVCVGKNAGGAMVGGHWNVIIGKDCLASGDTNGSVIIGLDTATGATGDNNVFIGRGACDGTATTSDNCIVLGYGADPSSTSTDNEITLGNTSITKFRIPGLNFSLKDTTATDNYVLTVDANGDCGWESAPADSTKLPLAGGTMTGNVIHNDSAKIFLGSDSDYSFWHDGTNAWHKCETGNLEFKTYGGSAGNLNFESAGSSTFKVNENTTALTLASNGDATFGGTVTASTKFDGSLFENNDGNVVVRAGHPYNTVTYKGYTHTFTKPTDGETQAKFQADGSCELYYDDSKKFETVTGGATITGTCTATTFSGSGASLNSIPESALASDCVGAAQLQDNIVREDKLKVSNAPTNGYVLTARSGNTGGMTWEAVSASDSTKMPLAGGSFTGDVIFTGDAANLTWDKSTDDLIFNDNAKAIFGTSSDGLEIHHDGSNSFIDETGTGILYIRSSSTIRLSDISGNNMILCEDGGETQLFHNGTEKLNTSSGGVTVSGTCTATAFAGPLTGNVTGNTSGSSGSCTGNAATATALATARTIAGVSFDGSANISLNNNAITNGAGYITSGGKVGQDVSTTKSNTFSISATMNGSAGFSDITGMSVTITPSSSSSKVMVWAISRVGAPNHANVRLVRGSTAIAVGDTDGIRTRTGTGECYNLGNSYRSMDSTIMYLDSPSTTSATTYKLQIACASTSYFNRTVYDDNHLVGVRPASTITVMEILA